MIVYMKREEAIRQKLHKMIDEADSGELEALKSILLDEQRVADGAFYEEMSRRWKEYRDGSARMYTHDEVLKSMKEAVKKVEHSPMEVVKRR